MLDIVSHEICNVCHVYRLLVGVIPYDFLDFGSRRGDEKIYTQTKPRVLAPTERLKFFCSLGLCNQLPQDAHSFLQPHLEIFLHFLVGHALQTHELCLLCHHTEGLLLLQVDQAPFITARPVHHRAQKCRTCLFDVLYQGLFVSKLFTHSLGSLEDVTSSVRAGGTIEIPDRRPTPSTRIVWFSSYGRDLGQIDIGKGY